jgi:hypothetical protein
MFSFDSFSETSFSDISVAFAWVPVNDQDITVWVGIPDPTDVWTPIVTNTTPWTPV